MKPNVDSVGVYPQLSHNRLPMDAALRPIGSLKPTKTSLKSKCVMTNDPP